MLEVSLIGLRKTYWKVYLTGPESRKNSKCDEKMEAPLRGRYAKKLF